LKNNECTIRISMKLKDGTRGSSQTIRKDNTEPNWTITAAAGKTYRMSSDQLLSHLFKAMTIGKTIVEVIPDSAEAQCVQIQALNIDRID
jgi:hypothetical protein